MAAGKEESPDLFMSVRLDDSRRLCKVLVTSQTTGQDVIELLKPDDDNVYSLVEVWKGCERPVAHEEKLKNVLLQWGSDVDDVVFLLKRKHSSSRQNQKQAKSSRNSPVPEQLQEKQQKVENLEKELQQKEKHLKSSRNKEATKHSLKTKYVKLLEARVIEQEEKLQSLQSVQDELFKTRIDNEKLVLELNRLRSMFVLKHQQLAEATARVELLSRELARSSQQNDISKPNTSTIERNAQHQQYKFEQSDIYKNQLLNQHNLTETQLWQLQANNGYPESALNQNGQVGKDILFLKHGILHERNELNGLLSWQNDEENDTETSADSGHVSNDSPSYQNKLDPNFQFFPAPPEMYCGKVERFDIDQDFGNQLKGTKGGVNHSGLSEVDRWSPQKNQSHSKGGKMNPPIKPTGNLDATQQLFVNTNVKQGGVGPVSRQQQVNRDSPVSISSLSSMSSESSRNDPQSFTLPGTRPTKTGPQPNHSSSVVPNNNTRNMKSRRDSGSRSSTPTNEGMQLTSDALPKSGRNSGSKNNTPTSEYKLFIPNENSSDGSGANRTAGSISHYHRNREGSFDKSSSPTLGPFKHERTPSLTSDSSSETSTIRARTPTIEKPVPNSLFIPEGSEARNSHLSPTVTKRDTATNSKQDNPMKSDPQTTKTPVVNKSGATLSQNSRPPMVLDLTPQNAKNSTQQNINRKKSPLSNGRFIPGLNDAKGHTSPASFHSQSPTINSSKVVETKSPTSDRGFDPKARSSSASFDSQSTSSTRLSSKVTEPKSPTSDRRFDPKGRISPKISEPCVETSMGSRGSKPEKGSSTQAPLSSPGVQELLNDMSTLKVTAREVKPIQIQTRAEKESDNIPVGKTAAKTNTSVTGSKLPSDNQAKRVHIKPPKPLPRKRTKTPPARNSVSDDDLVVLPSSQETKPSGNNAKSGESGLTKKTQSRAKNSQLISNELGTKAYDSILRSSRNKGGKKSGKRVSLDPHAVLLHASLEGELELVKSVIHQVEDPSYPNNEGLTALHHAVCNSHDDIVKFLIEYGCDINAADMQGWTSLHCAAANNSIEMCEFLISHGACVFAVTAIEGKTPSRCCEKESRNFEQCFEYLSDIENNFGISNEGVVYAVYAYQATRKDELSFECGECLTVVRRGDVNEKEWWWARDTRNQLGYIPRNLLGLHPPVAPDV